MVLLLGLNFPDRLPVLKVLTSFYGISAKSSTIAARPPAYRPPATSLPQITTPTVPSERTPSQSAPSQQDPPSTGATPPSPARHNILTRLLSTHHIHPTAKMGELPDATLTALTASLSNLTIENDLRRKVQEDIRRMRDMGSLRGRRHAMGLPVRGQRTRTQIKTAKKLNRIARRG